MLPSAAAGTGVVNASTRSSSTAVLTADRLQRPLRASCNYNCRGHMLLSRSAVASIARGRPSTGTTTAAEQLTLPCRRVSGPAKATKPFNIACKSTNGYTASHGSSGAYSDDAGSNAAGSSSSSNGGDNKPPTVTTMQAGNDDGNSKHGSYPTIRIPWGPICLIVVGSFIIILLRGYNSAQLWALCKQHRHQLQELSSIVVGSSEGLGVK